MACESRTLIRESGSLGFIFTWVQGYSRREREIPAWKTFEVLKESLPQIQLGNRLPYQTPHTRQLKQQEFISSVIYLKAENLISRYRQGWFLLTLLFLDCRWPLCPCLFAWSYLCASLHPNLLLL